MGEQRPLRVLAVSSVLLQHKIYGGMERYFDWVLRGLAELGHSITVATTKLEQTASRQDGFQIVGLPVALGSKGSVWERELRKFFHSSGGGADVVLSNSYAAYPLKTDPLPIVAILQGSGLVDLISSFRLLAAGRGSATTLLKEVLRLAKPPSYFSQRRLMRGSRGLVAVSQETKESLDSIYGLQSRQIDVIPSPVDSTLFHPALEKKFVPPQAGAPFRIFSAGSLNRQKGFHVLLDALALLNQRKPGCFHLSIAGQGREIKSLKEKCKRLQVEPIVEFCGVLGDHTLAEQARRHDLFVLATLREEGYPLVISEAMSSGLPVVATRVGGNPTAVRDGSDGLLVDVADVGGLAEAIDRLASNPALRAEMARAARLRAETELDWRIVARRVENVLVRVVEKQGSGVRGQGSG
ncbi:MAG: glycosyltransferase family 4 protein [Acidobacteriota bacterium]